MVITSEIGVSKNGNHIPIYPYTFRWIAPGWEKTRLRSLRVLDQRNEASDGHQGLK
jgi:hypothetical protein